MTTLSATTVLLHPTRMKYPTKLLTGFIYAILLSATLASTNVRGTSQKRDLNDDSSVLCRIVVVHTMYENPDPTAAFIGTERNDCIPIVDEKESDMEFPISLPPDFEMLHRDAMGLGELVVQVSPASFENDELTIATDADYAVVNDRRLNHLTRRNLQIKPVMTVAIVRVSTSDATPVYSLSELQSQHFSSSGTNFPNQFDDCSRGKLKWNLAPGGMIDVKIPNRVSEFNGKIAEFTTVVQRYMRDNLGYTNGVNAIADKVIMCLPPGTGTWAASAGINHWRVQMNNYWCTSLSASLHELGHTMGMRHANKDGAEYQDLVGYMSGKVLTELAGRVCIRMLVWF